MLPDIRINLYMVKKISIIPGGFYEPIQGNSALFKLFIVRFYRLELILKSIS